MSERGRGRSARNESRKRSVRAVPREARPNEQTFTATESSRVRHMKTSLLFIKIEVITELQRQHARYALFRHGHSVEHVSMLHSRLLVRY